VDRKNSQLDATQKIEIDLDDGVKVLGGYDGLMMVI
jgi:hypothetical protein